MGAVETEDFVHASGTFAGEDPPPAPVPADGVVGQQGVRSFTRNGVGDYTLELEERIGFLEAEIRVVAGLNQLVVIGGGVDFADTRLVQVRSYTPLGVPADCQIFSVQVLQIAVGPPGQLPNPGPPAPISAGGSCGPDTFIEVNGDDNPVALAYETQYDLNNNSGDEPTVYTLELPTILLADKGRCIWLYTCYQNDPMDDQNFGRAQVKSFDNVIKMFGNATSGPVDLIVVDDSLKMYHDGIDTWYMGN